MKQNYFKRFLALLLSLSMVLTPQLVAALQTTSEEQIATFREKLSNEERLVFDQFYELTSTLEASFYDPSSPRHPLDRFNLLEQELVDTRRDAINSRIKVTLKENDRLTRLKTVNFILALAEKSLDSAIQFVGEDRIRTTAELMQMDPIAHFHAIVGAAVDDENIAKLLDITTETSVEHYIDENLPPRRLYLRDLKINVVDYRDSNNPKVIQHLNQEWMEGSWSKNFSSQDFYSEELQGLKRRFEVTTKEGELLYRFHRPVLAVGFFGAYLVFLQEGPQGTKELRFIDLDYFKGAIGNTHLPSFAMPLIKDVTNNAMEIVNGQLRVGDNTIPKEAFQFVALVGRAEFNFKVALVDPQTQASAMQHVGDLAYAMDLNLQAMDVQTREMVNSALGGAESVTTLVDDAINAFKAQGKMPQAQALAPLREKTIDSDLLVTLNPTFDSIKNEVLAQERLTMTNRSLMVSKMFMNRLHLLMAKVSAPNPTGSPKLLQAMAMLAEAALHQRGKDLQTAWSDLNRHPIIKYGRYGVGVLASASLGQTIPEAYAFSLFDALQMGADAVKGYLEHSNYGLKYLELMGEAASTALSGVPSTAHYFDEEKLPRLGVLMVAMGGLVLSIYGSLHITANTLGTIKYFQKKKNWRAEAVANGMSRMESWKQTFIRYQQVSHRYYYQNLANAEAKSSGDKAKRSFSETDNQIVEDWLRDRAQAADKKATEGIRGLLGGVFGKTKEGLLYVAKSPFLLTQNIIMKTKGAISSFLGQTSQKTQAEIERQTTQLETVAAEGAKAEQSLKKNKRVNTVTTLAEALRQFALSYPSVLVTSRFSGYTWNYWYLIRNFALFPTSWPMFFFFPQLFRVGIQGNQHRVHKPTLLNGGYRNRIETWATRFKDWRHGTQELANIERFEKMMLPIEAISYEIALEHALAATIRTTTNNKDLLVLFESAQITTPGASREMILQNASPSTGIRSISDKKLSRLSAQQRAFFRSTFDQLYGEITQRFLATRVASHLPPNALGERLLKAEGVKHIDQLMAVATDLRENKNSSVRQELYDIANGIVADGRIYKEAIAIANQWSHIGERFLMNREHKVIAKLDPKNNTSIRRFSLAERQLGNVKAVVRAMNAMYTDIIVDNAAGLVMILVMYSAITEGMLAPLQTEMFGPDSWFFGSRYHFLNGFVAGVVMSAMANVWMKVQTDNRVDEAGGFDKVPLERDAEGGYLRYYLKTFFKNPLNKLMDHQVYSMQIAWANLSAAFVTIAVLGFLTLGRFDLGSFLVGYMVTFLTPLSGLSMKIEQTHELASRWQAGKIIQKLRFHPKILNWMNNDARKKRMPHSIGNAIYGMFMGPFIDMFQLMDTDRIGKRAFLNLFFYGYQPEEIVSKALQKVNAVAGGIPGVTPALEFCESLLTNNNTALDPAKLMNPPVKGGN